MTAAAPARSGRLPIPFYVLLLAVLVVGGIAGRTAAPLLQWTSPLVAVLLFVGARTHLNRLARGTFPERLARDIAETLAWLPHGNAKELFEQLLRAAESVHRALPGAPHGGARQQDVEQLVDHACRAAVDLSDLELAGGERAARLRDALTQRFAKGVEVLHRIRVELVHADPRQDEWQALLERLDDEARAWQAARLEVSALLSR